MNPPKRSITIVHLYPEDMNIYGDNGNVLMLKKRLLWRGISAQIVDVNVGDPIPDNVDIIVSGGGQDKGQLKVQEDLSSKASQLKQFADDGVVMLVVCGTYQLFGHRFLTHEGAELKGIGLLDVETTAGKSRLIGNVIIKSDFGELVGYENHSGLTKLAPDQKSFGTVIKGEGNNTSDNSEGAVYKNVIGTYLHGPVLPKNPQFADELIRRALVRKYGNSELSELPDELAEQAAEVAKKRPR